MSPARGLKGEEQKLQAGAGKRVLACKTREIGRKNTLLSLSIACLTTLLGNPRQPFARKWSISRLQLPLKWSISGYLSQRIATSQANIRGANDTFQANI
jgi:hypothetical protein